MSSFGGKMREYTNVSIDRFDGENLESTVYFLSHCHEDHMQGLSSGNLLYHFESNRDIVLYCSEITKVILLTNPKYSCLEKFLKCLPVEEAVKINIPDPNTGKQTQCVTVTLLPAAHMPGSVMFLFEGEEGTVLYTGDFRLERGGVRRLSALHYGDRVKTIKSLYIDTTFCMPQAYHIPSRQQCHDAVVSLTREWICRGADHMVIIQVRAQYGHESVYEVLSEALSQRVHVSNRKLRLYEQLPQLAPYVTGDSSSTQIHACSWQSNRPKFSRLPCCYHPPGFSEIKLRILTLSTMWFLMKDVTREEIVVHKRGLTRVCYSFHSSYSEIKDFVSYLQPTNVYPNVQPNNGDTLKQVQERLKQFSKMIHSKTAVDAVSPAKPLGMLYRPSTTHIKSPINSQSSSNDGLDFGDSSMGFKPKGNLLSEKNPAAGDAGSACEYQDSQDVMSQPGSDITDSQKTNKTDNSDVSLHFSDDEDFELTQLRENFIPIKGGSYGSHISYLSDDDDEEAGDYFEEDETQDKNTVPSSSAHSLFKTSDCLGEELISKSKNEPEAFTDGKTTKLGDRKFSPTLPNKDCDDSVPETSESETRPYNETSSRRITVIAKEQFSTLSSSKLDEDTEISQTILNEDWESYVPQVVQSTRTEIEGNSNRSITNTIKSNCDSITEGDIETLQTPLNEELDTSTLENSSVVKSVRNENVESERTFAEKHSSNSHHIENSDFFKNDNREGLHTFLKGNNNSAEEENISHKEETIFYQCSSVSEIKESQSKQDVQAATSQKQSSDKSEHSNIHTEKTDDQVSKSGMKNCSGENNKTNANELAKGSASSDNTEFKDSLIEKDTSKIIKPKSTDEVESSSHCSNEEYVIIEEGDTDVEYSTTSDDSLSHPDLSRDVSNLCSEDDEDTSSSDLTQEVITINSSDDENDEEERNDVSEQVEEFWEEALTSSDETVDLSKTELCDNTELSLQSSEVSYISDISNQNSLHSTSSQNDSVDDSRDGDDIDVDKSYMKGNDSDVIVIEDDECSSDDEEKSDKRKHSPDDDEKNKDEIKNSTNDDDEQNDRLKYSPGYDDKENTDKIKHSPDGSKRKYSLAFEETADVTEETCKMKKPDLLPSGKPESKNAGSPGPNKTELLPLPGVLPPVIDDIHSKTGLMKDLHEEKS